MYHQPILDVDDDDTRCPFFRNENQFVPRQEKLKKTRLSLRHAEVDMSLTAGRGTRWSERWHSDMPALCLPHPSSTAAGWQHRHNPATLSTFQHNLRLCFQEDREGRHTHWRTHTLRDTHTHTHTHTHEGKPWIKATHTLSRSPFSIYFVPLPSLSSLSWCLLSWEPR